MGLTGTHDVIHGLKRCSNKLCRVRHGYNYYVLNGQHVNTLSADDMKDGMLFTSAGRAWTTRYLQCHENLFFRGYVSSRSVEWPYLDAFSADGMAVDFREQHNDAMIYFMAVKELRAENKHLGIVIEDELAPGSLKAYHEHLHANVFPPADKGSVKELVADGHQKLRVLCSRSKRALSPAGDVGCNTHGWLIV